MKKTLVVLTACMLAFGVAACGNDKTKETETDETTIETTVESEATTEESRFHDEVSHDNKDIIKDGIALDSIKDVLDEDQQYVDKDGNDISSELINEHKDTTYKPDIPRKLHSEF